MKNEIWQLLDTRKPGGIETHVLQLAMGLKQAGEPIRVVFLSEHGEHPLKARLSTAGVNVSCLDGHLSSLLKALRQHQPRALHTHGYKAGLFGRIAGQLSGTRVLSTYHAGEIGRGRLAAYDWLDRHTARLSNKVFAVSDLIAQRIPGPVKVLDNFIETRDLFASRGQQIAFVGRLSEEKGADRFLQLAQACPEQQFHVYGDGPLGSQLRNDAAANVVFHGQQAEMDTIWPNIGLLVMPSRFEGLPMAALEAMGRHIPLLATRVGALPSLIRHGHNGWLVEQTELQHMQQHLRKWLDQTGQQREQFGRAAANTVKSRYAANVVIPQMQGFYNAE